MYKNILFQRNAVVKLLATTVPSKPILLTLPFIPVVQAGWFSSSDTTEGLISFVIYFYSK